MGSLMADATDRKTAGRPGRGLPPPIRTVPPGLLLVGIGEGSASNGELTAAELIALARAARRDARAGHG
ncbi:hypothetical protein ACRAWG_27085 [Methylobacterium sp. P31]